MSVPATREPLPASWRAAAALRTLFCSETAVKAVDVMLGVFGMVAAFGLCRSFLDWLKAPVDSSALIVLAMIVAFVASSCWFVRLVIRQMLLPKMCLGK